VRDRRGEGRLKVELVGDDESESAGVDTGEVPHDVGDDIMATDQVLARVGGRITSRYWVSSSCWE
jgi:hypothetical protein